MAGHVLYTVRTADGVEHESAQAAADYLGIARGTVYYHLHTHGHLENVKIKRVSRSKHLIEKRARKIKAFGKEFQSMSECSRWLGKGEAYVRILLRDNPGEAGMAKLREMIFAKLVQEDDNGR